MNISNAFIKPLLIMFWIDHIARRYQQQLIDCVSQQDGWISGNVHSIIDKIFNSKKPDAFINSMANNLS